MKIKVITLFSGYDSQCLALDRLKEEHPGFDYELLAWSEIDKYAIQASCLYYLFEQIWYPKEPTSLTPKQLTLF